MMKRPSRSFLDRNELWPSYYLRFLRYHPQHPDFPAAKRAYQQNFLKNAIYEEMGKKLLLSFAENNVFAVPLKGIWLLDTFYPGKDRVINDLDILVFPEAFQRAKELVRKLGYVFVYDNKGSHLIFDHPSGVRLELHYALINQAIVPEKLLMPVANEELRLCVFKGSLLGIPCHLLSLEVHFMFLCLHLLREHLGSFKWWGDILLLHSCLSPGQLSTAARRMKAFPILERFQLLIGAFSGDRTALSQLYRDTKACSRNVSRLLYFMRLTPTMRLLKELPSLLRFLLTTRHRLQREQLELNSLKTV